MDLGRVPKLKGVLHNHLQLQSAQSSLITHASCRAGVLDSLHPLLLFSQEVALALFTCLARQEALGGAKML